MSRPGKEFGERSNDDILKAQIVPFFYKWHTVCPNGLCRLMVTGIISIRVLLCL